MQTPPPQPGTAHWYTAAMANSVPGASTPASPATGVSPPAGTAVPPASPAPPLAPERMDTQQSGEAPAAATPAGAAAAPTAPAPEAVRQQERAAQVATLPTFEDGEGYTLIEEYINLAVCPSDDCSVMIPIGPHDPPSTVHMQTAKLQQVMVQTFLTAGTSVTEAISASHVKQFVRAMRNRSAAAEVSTAAEVSEASAAAEASTATSLPTPTVIPLVVRDGRRTKGMQPSTAWTLCGGWSDAQIGPPSNDELPQCQLVCIPTSTTRVPGQK